MHVMQCGVSVLCGLISGNICSAEAGGTGQEGSKHEGATAKRTSLPQTASGAALCTGLRAHSH